MDLDGCFIELKKYFSKLFKFSPKTGSGHVPLPEDLASKKGVINPQNKDNECFHWAILCALHPHPERIRKYKQYKDILNLDNIEFPVQADEVIL